MLSHREDVADHTAGALVALLGEETLFSGDRLW